ncbi:MAG: hypothetical protein JXB32_09645 [Deltaproteobacteria bacterium]|nr:hypothetical protein [Deltaproteobacteria bacterium]
MRFLVSGLPLMLLGCSGGIDLLGEGDDGGPESPADAIDVPHDATDAPPDRPVDTADPDTAECRQACTTAEDCVPVSCSCTCAGCGGFSYEDVVHRDCEAAWYAEHDCSPPTICPGVCCPPRRVDCMEGTCVVIDGLEPCPAPVGEGETVVTAMITTDPEHFVDREVVVVGTLTTSRCFLCNDLGPCGTCYPSLTLDGVMTLHGPEAGGAICGELIECRERNDSCLPRWECHPFEIGRRVRVRGTWQQVMDEPWETTLDELLNNYRLAVEAMEPADPVAGAGLYAGTITVTYSDHPSVTPFSSPVELVLAQGSEGAIAELMDPGTAIPWDGVVASGWHLGAPPAEPGDLVFEADLGLGRLILSAVATGFAGSYVYSCSGLPCRVESSLSLTQVH